jgi:hypothetical protein
MGVEKDRNTNRTTMTTCERNYGLRLATAYSLVDHDRDDLFVDPYTKIPMALGQMRWLFRKGDVILSNQSREEHQTFVVQFKEHGTKSGEIPIYTYPDEDVPERSENGMTTSSQKDHRLTSCRSRARDSPRTEVQFGKHSTR